MKPSEGNLSPCDPKDEKVALQSLFNLFLVARSLSATFHTDLISNFKSVIQNLLKSFVQVSPKVWHKDDPSPAKIDCRTEVDEGFDQYREEPPGIEVPEFHDVPKKTIYLQSLD